MKTIKITVLILIMFSLYSSHSQVIKVTKDDEGYGWVLTNYTLPDFIMDFRIFNENNECVNGGEMDAECFYSVNYLPIKVQKGKYRFIVYICFGEPPNTARKILFTKEFVIK